MRKPTAKLQKAIQALQECRCLIPAETAIRYGDSVAHIWADGLLTREEVTLDHDASER